MNGNYEITMLPNSTSDLTSLPLVDWVIELICLTDALEDYCYKRRCLPYLGMNTLRELDLSGTAIEDVPQVLEKLFNPKMKLFAKGLLPKLMVRAGNLHIGEPMLDSHGSQGERLLTNDMVGDAFIENPEMVLNRVEDRQVSQMPMSPPPSQTPPSLQTPMAPSPSPDTSFPADANGSIPFSDTSFPASFDAVLAIRGSDHACLPSNAIRGQIKGFIWKTSDTSEVLHRYHQHLLADCRSDETNGANHKGEPNVLSSIEPDSSRLGDPIFVVFAIVVFEPCPTDDDISTHFCSNCSAYCPPSRQHGVWGRRAKLH